MTDKRLSETWSTTMDEQNSVFGDLVLALWVMLKNNALATNTFDIHINNYSLD